MTDEGRKKEVKAGESMEYTGHMGLSLLNDVLFKYVFGAEESIPILTALVNAVLTDSGFAPAVRLKLRQTAKNPAG